MDIKCSDFLELPSSCSQTNRSEKSPAENTENIDNGVDISGSSDSSSEAEEANQFNLNKRVPGCSLYRSEDGKTILKFTKSPTFDEKLLKKWKRKVKLLVLCLDKIKNFQLLSVKHFQSFIKPEKVKKDKKREGKRTFRRYLGSAEQVRLAYQMSDFLGRVIIYVMRSIKKKDRPAHWESELNLAKSAQATKHFHDI